MSPPHLLITTLIGLFVLGSLVWRVLARRASLPCPPAFIMLLENRIMESAAGPSAIIERAKIETGMRVLDAGCGPGRLSLPIARHIGQEGVLVALDIQSDMLLRLAERLAESGLKNVTTIQGGLGRGLLGKSIFDRAVLVTVLGEIPDRQAALTEIFDSLKPGGLLSVTEVLPDPHYQGRKTVRRIAEEAGFRVEVVYSTWRAYTLNLIRPAAL